MPKNKKGGQGYRTLIVPGVFVILASTLAALIGLYGVYKKGDWDAKWITPVPESTGILVPQEKRPHVKTRTSARQQPAAPEFLRLTVMDSDHCPLRDVSFHLDGMSGVSNDSGVITVSIARLHAECATAMFRIYLSKPGFTNANYYVGLLDNEALILKTK